MLRMFSSESVAAGHPDKVCDQIADAILDAHLEQDPRAHVAVEALAAANGLLLAGEVRSTASVEPAEVARRVLAEIGYGPLWGYDPATLPISIDIVGQSAEIAVGVDRSLEARTLGPDAGLLEAQGAGDQGMMFGYATDETPELMPAPIMLAHELTRRLGEARALLPWLGPDGKAQATIAYTGDIPAGVDTVVVSAQHAPGMDAADVRSALLEVVVSPALRARGFDPACVGRVLVNPSGSFAKGGPAADSGLTGRKIIVDTYGGAARHGGGAFSGKDPSKVDRSGAYAMRWVAKNVVASGMARRAELQVAYAIGQAKPVGLWIDTFGTEVVPHEEILRAVLSVFDLRPAAIERELRLREPQYRALAAGGHFGRSGPLWEDTGLTRQLRQALPAQYGRAAAGRARGEG